MKKKGVRTAAVLILAGMLAVAGYCFLQLRNADGSGPALNKGDGAQAKAYFTAEDFGVKTVKSANDQNGNGIDDYTDIMLGARADAEKSPAYRSAYYQGGYPPENEGVCTDVIWRAFRNAGFNLKDMVDVDIAANSSAFPRVNGSPDPNIDFRRVPNLKVFFERHALSLTLDTSKIEEWQPGDIVTYGDYHIAVVSDKRCKDGKPYIIHNMGQSNREEPALTYSTISGHFRFKAQ